MKNKSKISPIARRRTQIEKQIETLKAPKNQKVRRDFKTDERFEEWTETRDRKLRELDEELTILDNPGDYFELPLALAAVELGVTLDEVMHFVREELIDTSFLSDYLAGARITRDELARAIEIGAEELLRLANKPIDETFAEAVEFMRNDDVSGVERCFERIERFGYAEPYWAVCYTTIKFMNGEYENVFLELPIGLEFFDRERDTSAISSLQALKQAIEAIPPRDHLGEVIRERILAVAEGKKLKPYEETYSKYQATDFPSRMDENQRRAMFLSTVVVEAIHKYRLTKSVKRAHGFKDDIEETEFERVVRNAIYTAMEAERTYDDSPTSKLFVDRFADLLPKRWVPAESITFLPKS